MPDLRGGARPQLPHRVRAAREALSHQAMGGVPVSGDPLDLDAAESLAREMADSPWLTVEDLDDLREVARSALALVAEVRRLRAGSMGP